MEKTEVADFKIITVAELPNLIASGNAQLVDVRTDAEIARGRIAGAICLPLHLLPMRLQDLDAKKSTVFYCQMGGRSAQAAAFAAAQGLGDVYNLQGGITAWAHAGGNIVV
ncbi:rhodanese-like domain-containing protein [Sideroxydans lithotrophicus]|uniref:rhodanese-like domain-containing protein n=1 Tax=Sideroxydans lithotrophicus TaxID=63745 RepID=UPI001CC10212|nr:rhodanese-like domain-containing protein [Sideroxydans lithotrophicus]